MALLTYLQLPARTWQTVDDFQYAASKYSGAFGMVIDSLGKIYVCGRASDSSNASHGIVRMSTDGGLTWSTALDYVPQSHNTTVVATNAWLSGGICVDFAENIYTAGFYRDTNTSRWVVVKSSDHGASWDTVDDFLYAPGANSIPSGLVADRAGNVFVCGMGFQSGVYHWLVRRSQDGGKTWVTVDDFLGATNAAATSIAANFLAVFVGGGACLVRGSTDGGATWSTADNYSYPSASAMNLCALATDGSGNIFSAGQVLFPDTSGQPAAWIARKGSPDGTSWETISFVQPWLDPLGIGVDPPGNLYAFGGDSDTSSWIVAQSEDGGLDWALTDSFSYVPGQFSAAKCFASDAAGNLYVGGVGFDETGTASHWLIRKLASSTSQPPTLHVIAAGHAITVSWPYPSTGFVLESTPSLTLPNWQDAPEVPVTTNDQRVVTIPISQAERYFRLHQQ